MTTQETTAEKAGLQAVLDAQRQHVIGILEGLDDAELGSSLLPSGWTAVGLVGHLALDVERFWFRAVVDHQPSVVAGLTADRPQPDAWRIGEHRVPQEVLALYTDEIARADAVIAATALDAAPGWWPDDRFGGWRLRDLREVLLHVITETACHAGHLDAVRELIDGRRWLVLS